MRPIKPETLVPMDLFVGEYPIHIDLAYARADNLLFGERIYREDARLWLHEDLAKIVLQAAKTVGQQGFRMILYDGLRTVEAQEAMLQTRRVKDNPHWLEEPRLLSPPGAGGHPRGMAVDVALETADGKLLDMGTPFDYLAEDADPEHNPAHRQYVALKPDIAANREILDIAMIEAAKQYETELLPLPQEWWDFRLPKAKGFPPLSDHDLPANMRLMD